MVINDADEGLFAMHHLQAALANESEVFDLLRAFSPIASDDTLTELLPAYRLGDPIPSCSLPLE